MRKKKSAKEEADLKVLRMESELQSYKNLFNEKSRDYMEAVNQNEILEEKNARLRKEIINKIQERNDAHSLAKDKKLSANIKAQKI